MKEKIFDIILSRTLFGCKFWIVWDVCFFIFNVLKFCYQIIGYLNHAVIQEDAGQHFQGAKVHNY